MIEDNKIIKSIEAKVGGKSGTYWTITWDDGKFDNIFNGDWLPLLEQSQAENRPLHFTKEKTENSKYYNIKTLELIEESKPALKPARDEITRDEQIERAVWIKELGEGLRSGYIPKDSPEALFYRKEMDRVLGIKAKEAQPAKSKLVEEAKRLGATEIGKEDSN